MSTNHTITDNELFHDLTVKYEALEHEFIVLNLTIVEYKNEINELKAKNTQIVEENKHYKESMQFQQHQSHINKSLSITLDDLDSSNLNLNMQLFDSSESNKQLQSEISALKVENEQYKKALEQSDSMRQKREQMYASNKLKLINRIQDLSMDIITLKEQLSNAYTIRVDQDIDETQSLLPSDAARQKSNDAIKVKYRMSNRNSGRNSARSSVLLDKSASGTKENTPEHVMYFRNHSLQSNEMYSSAGELLDVPFIDKQVSFESNTDVMVIRKEELYKLKNMNHENEELIDKLNHAVTDLKERNRELKHNLHKSKDKRFGCTLLEWFS